MENKENANAKGEVEEVNTIGEAKRTTRNLQGREGFVKKWHFDKHFAKNRKKKAPLVNFRSFFSQTLLKLHFEWKI